MLIKTRISLNEPHPAQEQIISEAQRFNVLSCGRRFGKSALAINLCSETAIQAQPVGYFAPTYKLLEGTYKECLNTLEPIIKKKHDNQFIELITGGSIEFWSLDNPNAGRSRKYKRVIVDEAAFVKQLWEAWTQSIRPTLTDLIGDAWFMSTPRGKNDFFKLYNRGKGGEANWQSWTKTTYDNPFIDANEINDARKDLPQLAFSQEYLAEFNDNIANPFGFNFIQQCTYPLSIDKPICFGIDLAKYVDWTVIIGLDKNGAVCFFQRFQKDWKQTQETILNLPIGVPIILDSTGVGDPIGEEISRVRGDIELVKFTQTSKQQLMEGLAMAIQKRSITFPEGPIKDELENFEFEYTRSGVKYSAPAGLHDDCVMSLALAVSRLRKSVNYGNYDII
jgi:hypothetical protein